MTDRELLTTATRRWRVDARAFVRELFGVTLDAWQDRALVLIVDPATRRLALKACKGPGKTACLAWIICWFLTCHDEAKIGCTSITEANIDTNLWPELYKWIHRSTFLGTAFEWTKSAVTRRGNPNWFAVKRSWPKSGDSQQQADALAGIHADHVMFVLDEVGGIPQAVMVTAEAVLATDTSQGGRALLLIAGNPTHTSGPLHRACTIERALWEVITITGDPDDPERSPRISLEWAREQIASYGRDNPWVLVNVLGQFPPSSINALLGVEDVEASMRRKLEPMTYDWAQRRLGVDVARFGDDRSVIFPRQGLMAYRPATLRNERTTAIAARCARTIAKWGAHGDEVVTFVDDTGHWGHGVIDNLITTGFALVVPVQYHARATDPRFKNMRAQNWMAMAEWVKAGGALPYMPELVPELTEITYTFLGGQFVLEDKDQVKARIGMSPDLADALSNTFAAPDAPANLAQSLGMPGRRQTVAHEFDPFAAAEQLARGTQVVTHDFDPFR